MTFSATDFSRLARACLSAAERASDADGFVTVLSLLHRFNAKLIVRPLLVEAMLCQVDEAERANSFDGARWAVLVDSDRYPISYADVENETPDRPLSARFRNTVAHELAHSLSFRLDEFGISFVASGDRSKNIADAVRAIEDATERLSPILLIPPAALDFSFPSSRLVISADDVSKACKRLGVSRYLLINRLKLLREVDSHLLRERMCFRNLAIGLGDFSDKGAASIRGWPIYQSFDRGIAPSTLWKAMDEKSAPAGELLGDQDFILNGGANLCSNGIVRAGTKRFQSSEALRIECSVVPSVSGISKTFLFVVNGSIPG